MGQRYAMILLSLLVPFSLNAQSIPSTSPATTQAATQRLIDQTAPKAAARSLENAMETGDVAAIRQILYARSLQEQKMIDAIAAMAHATAELHRSAVAAFGDQGAKGLIGDFTANAVEASAQMDAAAEKVEGDFASLSLTADTTPLVLVKADGKWRVPVSQLARSANAATVNDRLAQIAAQTGVINEVAKEIDSGRFHSGEDAAETLHAKMMKVAMQQVSATTTTTTRKGE